MIDLNLKEYCFKQLNEPIFELITINKKSIKTISIDIIDDEYDIVQEIAKKMWSNTKSGFYGSGMLNTKSDPYRVERIGKLGEAAFGKLFNLPVNIETIENGDNGIDFVIGKEKIDVKCSARDYGVGLVKATSESGKVLLHLNSDCYVFGYIESDDIVNKKAKVKLIGYKTKQSILKTKTCPARMHEAKHMNYEIPYESMSSIYFLLNNKNKYYGENWRNNE